MNSMWLSILVSLFYFALRADIVEGIGSKTHDAAIGEVPSVIMFKHTLEDEVFCLGSLITKHFVATAGSCVASREEQCLNFLGFMLSGTIDKKGKDCAPPCEARRPRKIFVHEGFYDPIIDEMDDIALIQLNEPFTDANITRSVHVALERPSVGSPIIHMGFRNQKYEFTDILQVGAAYLNPYTMCTIPPEEQVKRICISMKLSVPGCPSYYEGALLGLSSRKENHEKYGIISTDVSYYLYFIESFVSKNEMRFLRKSGSRATNQLGPFGIAIVLNRALFSLIW